jgi:hypothetical protein
LMMRVEPIRSDHRVLGRRRAGAWATWKHEVSTPVADEMAR